MLEEADNSGILGKLPHALPLKVICLVACLQHLHKSGQMLIEARDAALSDRRKQKDKSEFGF